MIRSYSCDARGAIRSGLSIQQMRQALARRGGLLWVDIEGPEDREVELLLETFGLHPLTVEDCIMPNVRPKVEEFDRYVFVILQGIRRVDGALKTVELDACLGEQFLITVRSEPMRSVEETCARVEKQSPIITRGADFLFYVITDALIDSYLPVLEEVERQVDALESKMLGDSTERTLRDLFQVYNDVGMLRRTLAPHHEIVSQLNRGDRALIKEANRLYFRDVHDHLLRMSDLVDSCREVITLAMDAHATIVSNRLNEIMKSLTAFATLALPLVIVTGIFGMNFSEHPELGPRWIYQLVSVGLLVSIPVMLVAFRKSRWL